MSPRNKKVNACAIKAWAKLVCGYGLPEPWVQTSGVSRFFTPLNLVRWRQPTVENMKNKIILDLLLAIPKECTQYTIQEIKLQIIDSTKREQLLNSDPDDRLYHQCDLPNGSFIFTTQDNKLTSLYKIV